MADFTSRFDNPAADQYDPNYVDPNAYDATQAVARPAMSASTALNQALQMVGLFQFPTNPVDPSAPTYSSVYQYQKPVYHWSKPDLLGVDPTTGQITPDVGDDRVFWGSHRDDAGVPQPHIGNPRLSEVEGGGPMAGDVPDTTTVSQAMDRPYLWDDAKVSDVMKRMREAGINVQSFDDMMNVWQSMVQRASRTYTLSNGKKEVTPWDVLSSIKKENVDAGVVDKNGNIVQKSVQKTVNDVSDADAWATLRQSMTAMLGRKPTDQEVRDFASRANAMAANNPSVTTTTSKTDAETGHTTTSSHTKGGFTASDAQQMATDDLESTDEFAAYQSATTYMNALLGAIGETAGGMA